MAATAGGINPSWMGSATLNFGVPSAPDPYAVARSYFRQQTWAQFAVTRPTSFVTVTGMDDVYAPWKPKKIELDEDAPRLRR